LSAGVADANAETGAGMARQSAAREILMLTRKARQLADCTGNQKLGMLLEQAFYETYPLAKGEAEQLDDF
jgi:hypothetical protein